MLKVHTIYVLETLLPRDHWVFVDPEFLNALMKLHDLSNM